MDLTTAQLSRLRTRPHRTRLWLGIFRPQVIFSAQINQAGIAKGARQITVTAISGDVNLVQGGETCYISVIAEGKELGRIRVRSATSSQITVAENSISWVNGWYLTIVRYFEPWGVFPRIALDANNVPIFYKDYDIVYTDQNHVLDPIVCLGPDHAGFLIQGDAAPTGTHQVWYTSSGSFDPTPGGGLASYDWHFEGGDPTGSTAPHPGYITYTGCGNFVTSLAVTTDDGKSFTGRRHIQILNRPENAGSCKPLSKWGIRSLEGNRAQGGYTARLWVREEVDVDDIVDGALVVVFSEDWEGYVETKLGANAENRGSILFVGYILDDSIRYDPETNLVDFKAGSIAIRMGELSTFSTALDSKVNAMTWTDMRQMTIDRALIHFLRWHSTVLAVADFAQTGDTKPVEFVDMSRGNVYEAVNGLLQTALMGTMTADRQGKLWCEIEANMLSTGTTRQANDHMQSIIEITRQDWRKEIGIERNPHADLAYIELGGIAYSGPGMGTFDAYLSGAPGTAPEYFGSTERLSGLVISSQTQLNELAGLAWSARNALYPKVTVPLAGDYRFIDIAPQQRIEMTVKASDTFRRIVWDKKPFIPNSIQYNWDPTNQVLLMDLGLTEETGGTPGETIVIPVDPPYDRAILPDWDIEFPPIIPPPSVGPPIQPEPGTGDTVYVAYTNTLARTRNFWDDSPTWEDITPPFITGSADQIWSFRLDPFNPKLSAMCLVYRSGGGNFVYWTTNLNDDTPSWSLIMDEATEQSLMGTSAQRMIYTLVPVPIQQGAWWGLGRNASLGGGTPTGRVPRTYNYGSDWEEYHAQWEDDNGPNEDAANFIAPVPHLANSLVYASYGERLYCSFNGGKNWIEQRDLGSPARIYHAYVPYGSTRVYWVQQNGFLYYSDQNGWTGSEVNMSLWWASGIYVPRKIGNPADRGRVFHHHPQDGKFYAALGETQQLINTTVFAVFSGAWEIRRIFVEQIAPTNIHASNPDRHYALSVTGESGWILGSKDGGYTWLKKAGNFVSAVRPFSGGGAVGNGVAIEPMWVE